MLVFNAETQEHDVIYDKTLNGFAEFCWVRDWFLAKFPVYARRFQDDFCDYSDGIPDLAPGEYANCYFVAEPNLGTFVISWQWTDSPRMTGRVEINAQDCLEDWVSELEKKFGASEIPSSRSSETSG